MWTLPGIIEVWTRFKSKFEVNFFLHRDLDNFAVSNESTANYRSSRPEVFCKKGVLKDYAKFKGKHLCQSLFLNKFASLRPATLLKKETLAQVFSCEFCEISRNTFYTEHLWTTASAYVCTVPINRNWDEVTPKITLANLYNTLFYNTLFV